MEKKCAVILAGGEGTRMKSHLPKPMFEVLGEPMLDWVIKACQSAEISDLCVVTGYNSQIIEEHLCDRFITVHQDKRLGTGHAVMQAKNYISEHSDDDVLVLYGDAPFVDKETITKSYELHKSENNSVTVVSAMLDDPTGYGRIVRDKKDKSVKGIVEHKDANKEQQKIKEINSGIYWFKGADLLAALDKLQPNNVQGEYYLTDTLSILIADGKRAGGFVADDAVSVMGANSRKELLQLNNIARMRVIEKHMNNGVEFICTDGVIIGRDVIIGEGSKILLGTQLKGKTIISDNCVIGPNCIIDDCIVGFSTTLNSVQAFESTIGDNVKIGPFVHIRPGSNIQSGVKIGDFVEIKNSNIGERTAVAHLTYVGDSDVGKGVNFGCGCVTVNFDGTKKNRTTIGDFAFIGCNTNMIAPVKIGDGAYTAAGTTVVKDVPDNALALDRGEFRIKEGYALKKLRVRRKQLMEEMKKD